MYLCFSSDRNRVAHSHGQETPFPIAMTEATDPSHNGGRHGCLSGDDLLTANLAQNPWKLTVFRKMQGAAGRLLGGRLRITGMLTHPVLLTRLTKTMSLM